MRQGENWGRIRATLFNAVLFLLVAALPGLGSCYAGPDKKDLAEGPDGGIDTTTYAGMQIIGETKVGDSAPVVGPLDLFQLQYSLLAKCYEELITDDPEGLGRVCTGDSSAVDLTSDTRQTTTASVTQCKQHFCYSLLFNCLGYKNLELAEAVDIVEFDAAPIGSSSEPTFKDGAPVITLDLTTAPNAATSGTKVHYRIPPMPTPIKSLPAGRPRQLSRTRRSMRLRSWKMRPWGPQAAVWTSWQTGTRSTARPIRVSPIGSCSGLERPPASWRKPRKS